MKISRAHKLDDDDRINIQAGIYKGYTLAAIAQHLHVNVRQSLVNYNVIRNTSWIPIQPVRNLSSATFVIIVP